MMKLSVESVLDSRGITSLMHFTRVENLESILRDGIIPRTVLDSCSTGYVFNDFQRLDQRPDCSSFSVEFPNSCLFDCFKRKYPGETWAVLELDARAMLTQVGIKFFCYDNAARRDLRSLVAQGCLTAPSDFERMFCESYSYSRYAGSGIVHRNGISNIQPFLPTSIQAEILIPGVVSAAAIRKVHFQSVNDCGAFLRSVSDRNLLDRFDFNGNGNVYFLDRNRVRFIAEE